MSKFNTALVIIYNHQYNNNIEMLNNIYKDRFSYIYHLVPFYNGCDKNVVPVFESSYYFQGYVSQGLRCIYDDSFINYFFVSDDLLLNPIINEHNYISLLNIPPKYSFFPGFTILHDVDRWWARVRDAYRWRIDRKGVEVKKLLPSYEDALSIFKERCLEVKALSYNQIYRTPKTFKDLFRPIRSDSLIKDTLRHAIYIYRYFSNMILFKHIKYDMPYPLVGGYSDIFIISSEIIKLFSHYCGMFAATDLFVELAIPTALVFCTNKIVTEKDSFLKGKALWSHNQLKELDKYQHSLECLISNFPDSYLYLHPIKLSKWRP